MCIGTMSRSSDVVNQALFARDALTTSLIHIGVAVVWKTAKLCATLRVMWNVPSCHRQNKTWNGHFASTQATRKRDLSLRVIIYGSFSIAPVSLMKLDASSLARKLESPVSASFGDPHSFGLWCLRCFVSIVWNSFLIGWEWHRFGAG